MGDGYAMVHKFMLPKGRMQKIRSALYVCSHRLKSAEGSKGSRVSHFSRIPHISKIAALRSFDANSELFKENVDDTMYKNPYEI